MTNDLIQLSNFIKFILYIIFLQVNFRQQQQQQEKRFILKTFYIL